jgi:hypothetical protein
MKRELAHRENQIGLFACLLFNCLCVFLSICLLLWSAIWLQFNSSHSHRTLIDTHEHIISDTLALFACVNTEDRNMQPCTHTEAF